jgi:O-antigen/teichoic acid export membrane protein
MLKVFRANISGIELALIRLFTLVVNLFTIQYVLIQIGAEKFGVYSTVLILLSLFSLLDFGLSNGLISPLSIAYADKDFLRIKRIVSSTVVSILLLTITTSVIGFLALRFFNISNYFNVPSVLIPEFNQAFSLIFMLIPAYSFSLLVTKISVSLGLANQNARWLAGSVFFTSVFSIFVICVGWSLIGLVFVQIATPTIIGLINFALLACKFPEIRPRLLLQDVGDLKKLFKNGALYFFLQIAAFFSYQADVLIVAIILDPINVTTLSITWKVASIPFLIVSAALLPLWQKSAIKFEEEGSVQQLTFDLLRKLTPILFFWSTFFLLFGAKIITSWTQGEVFPSLGLVVSCSIWSFMATLMSGLSVVLNGIRAKKFLYASTSFFVFFNVLLSALLTSITQNPMGPIIGSILASLITFICPFMIFYKKILNRDLAGKEDRNG